MIAVKEMMKMESGMPVLVCDLFKDEDVTNRIRTDIGVFDSPEFAVGTVTACFAPPTTRTILLRTHKDCSGIKSVEFI